jgi:C1A family cysteine protease
MAKLVLPNGRGHGWKPDTPDHRDYTLRMRGAFVHVPDVVGLKEEFFPPVRNQGQLGSCTGFGTSGALMYKLRQRKRSTELSALYAYYQARVLEGSVREDAGAEIRDVVKAAANIGIAREKCWPYRPRRFAAKPSAEANKSAAPHQVVRYYRCDGVEEVLQALAADMPVVFGFSCFSNLGEADRNGFVPMPGPKDGLEGGHCVWIVKGDQPTRVFRFQNSWGDWGDHGFGYLPFAYFENGLADDAWAIDHE